MHISCIVHTKNTCNENRRIVRILLKQCIKSSIGNAFTASFFMQRLAKLMILKSHVKLPSQGMKLLEEMQINIATLH